MSVEERVLELLAASGRPYELLTHEPVTGAEHASEVRGTPLEIGGKAIVMKLDRGIGFAVLALGGDRRVDNKSLRVHLRVRRYRFATRAELLAQTGLAPGCVPPLGRPVLPLPLYVDAQLVAGATIAFTAGTPTRSVVMATADWLAVAQPVAVVPLCYGTT